MVVKMLFTSRHFKLDGNINLKINEFIFSDNKAILQSEYSSPEFRRLIGDVRASTSFRESVIGYSIGDFDSADSNVKLIEWTHSIHRIVEFYWIFLWFAKDTNASLGELIVYVPDKHTCAIVDSLNMFQRADARKSATSFNLEDLKKADILARKYRELFNDQPVLTIEDYKVQSQPNYSSGIYISHSPLLPYNQNSMLERAILFLRFALHTEFMPMKIAFYIPVLESLFSNENMELKHKVSERCANYIGGTRNERLANFQTIRSAYDLRSNLLHGSKLSQHGTNLEKDHNSLATQINLCIRIDEVVRKVLTKAILEDGELFVKGNAEELLRFYDSLIFL